MTKKWENTDKFNPCINLSQIGEFEGEYVGSHFNKDIGKKGTDMHVFKNKDGIDVEVYGFGLLNWKLKEEQDEQGNKKYNEGDYLKLVYMGKKKNKSGDDCKQVSIYRQVDERQEQEQDN